MQRESFHEFQQESAGVYGKALLNVPRSSVLYLIPYCKEGWDFLKKFCFFFFLLSSVNQIF